MPTIPNLRLAIRGTVIEIGFHDLMKLKTRMRMYTSPGTCSSTSPSGVMSLTLYIGGLGAQPGAAGDLDRHGNYGAWCRCQCRDQIGTCRLLRTMAIVVEKVLISQTLEHISLVPPLTMRYIVVSWSWSNSQGLLNQDCCVMEACDSRVWELEQGVRMVLYL